MAEACPAWGHRREQVSHTRRLNAKPFKIEIAVIARRERSSTQTAIALDNACDEAGISNCQVENIERTVVEHDSGHGAIRIACAKPKPLGSTRGWVTTAATSGDSQCDTHLNEGLRRR
jgi:hypothetical protein